MKQRNKYIALGLFMVITVLISSCKTTRHTSQVALTKHSVEERAGMIQSHALPYKTFSGNLRFGMKQGNRESISVNAQLKIVKDEMIQLSLRIPVLGIEAARINISPWQALVIDRLNKAYFTESMENLKAHLPINFDFYSLQSLFTNHLFIVGKQEITPSDYASFNYREDEFSATLNLIDSCRIAYNFTSDNSHRILKTEIHTDNKDVDMNWDYADFGQTSINHTFPMKMNMSLATPNDSISMYLNFSSIDIDVPLKLNAEIPEKYKQIDWEQAVILMKSLLNKR
ncbi:MAG: DUF4292 domain-containing protein [Dysgonamonadaceae bacterium]|jgi:hypothetical protein|nr:DUF4292 domain-containing protein [Dysgonamonadaceae bacterium]